MAKQKTASRGDRDKATSPTLPAGAVEAVGELGRLQALAGTGTAPGANGSGADLGLGDFFGTMQTVEALYGMVAPGSRLGLADLFAEVAAVANVAASVPSAGRGGDAVDPSVLESLAARSLEGLQMQAEVPESPDE